MISPEDEKNFRDFWKECEFEAGQHGMLSVDPEYQEIFDETIATVTSATITLIPPIEYELKGLERDKLHYSWQA